MLEVNQVSNAQQTSNSSEILQAINTTPKPVSDVFSQTQLTNTQVGVFQQVTNFILGVIERVMSWFKADGLLRQQQAQSSSTSFGSILERGLGVLTSVFGGGKDFLGKIFGGFADKIGSVASKVGEKVGGFFKKIF